MKKTMTALLLVLALILPCFTGLAESDHGKPLPEIGSTVCGFTVIDHYPLADRDATCVYMVHDKTKANLTYIACGDSDRAFDITFRTPAVDDKGIPHVYEHATLCGSEKYPDPSLFFTMMNQTYNTYLNAMTMQTCTTFPAASLSEDQLYVYADYILSGVFSPLIMKDERAMMREAYRYELTDPNADITLAGTVYSEMQGALSMAGMAMTNMKKVLYPGSILGNIAGGDPAVIPTLTHQELIDFHNDYYHPSNSMITLYGNIDYEKFLKLIDEEYLSKYDYREITLDDSAYEPFTGYREQVFTFPVAQSASAQPLSVYGIALPNATVEDVQMFNIMIGALGQESSVFKQLMLERLPEASSGVIIDAYSPIPALGFMAYGVDESNKDVFVGVVEDTIKRLLDEGLDMTAIETLCRSKHFTDVANEGVLGAGVKAAMNFGTEWGRTCDPYAYKKVVDMGVDLMSYVKNDRFNEAFRRNLTNPTSTAMAITLPDVGGLERQSAELHQRLLDMKANMTQDEIDALVTKTKDFEQWTQGNLEHSMIDKVKVVSAQTLPEEVNRYYAKDEIIDGVRVITSEVDTSDVVQIELLFDASALPFETLLDYSVMSELIMRMPTENYTELEIADALNNAANTPSLSSTAIKHKNGGYDPRFKASWSTTQDRIDASFALFEELLFGVDFSNTELIRRVINDKLINQKMLAIAMPDMLLTNIGNTLIDDDALYSEYLSGDENMRYRKQISSMSDDEITQLAERMKQILNMLLNKNNLIVTIVGTEQSIEQTIARAKTLYDKLDDTKREKADYAGKLHKYEAPYAAAIDLTVQYNMQIMSLKGSEFEENGKMLVMNQIVKDKVVFPVLRFQNSAYGASCGLDGKSVYVASYRDPNLAATFGVFKELGGLIRNIQVTQDDVDGYITNAYSILADPINAYNGGATAVSNALTGETTFDDLLRYMKEVKQFTPEDIVAYSAIYDQLAEKGQKVTVGGIEAIEANKDMFKTISTVYVD